MKRHIFRSICMVAFVAVISLFILTTGRLYSYFTGVQFQQLKVQTELASKAVNDEGMDYFKHLSKSVDYRITWIDKNGFYLITKSWQVKWKTIRKEKSLKKPRNMV